MKTYLQYVIEIPAAADADIVIAMLSAMGFDGFEENGNSITATALQGQVTDAEVNAWLDDRGYVYHKQELPEQNWNALWESNYEPVIVPGFACVRAHFHPPRPDVPFNLLITPKMSFGTGHHATTWQMMDAMRHLPVAGKSVLDFGTGTGVLAILAEKMGAIGVEALDNDTWSYENAQENMKLNSCSRIKLWQADNLDSAKPADLVLANINKHILLSFAPQLARLVKTGGNLLMSGLLKEDAAAIEHAYEAQGFTVRQVSEKNGWIAVLAQPRQV